MRCEWGKAVAAFVLLLMIISVLCGCSGNEVVPLYGAMKHKEIYDTLH